MFPFWEVALKPVLQAAEARKVVEIGALRGENTVLMIEALGPDAELHVIDPVPAFDPAEHEQEFPGQYIFHKDLSVNALPQLEAMDVAFIDGDHNWFTVYTECKMIAESAEKAGEPLPVLLLHDVLWPYGRRDLYYSPDNVPAEHRQPYEYKGMLPGQKKLRNKGGLNAQMANATLEGGERNGVMAGLEDFLEEYEGGYRHVVLPIYFGLSIVVSDDRAERFPALGKLLDHLESQAGLTEVLELSEDIRLKNQIMQHNIMSHHERVIDRAAERYLKILSGALINEHYLENEVRMSTLARAVGHGIQPNVDKMRDPRGSARVEMAEARAERRSGRNANGYYFPWFEGGSVILDGLHQTLENLRAGAVPGDAADIGVGMGGAGIFIRGYFDAWEWNDRKLWVIDEFKASDGNHPAPDTDVGDLRPDLNLVRDGYERFDMLDDRVSFAQGPLANTLGNVDASRFAMLRFGAIPAADLTLALEQLHPRLSNGGAIVIDTSPEGTTEAIEAFRSTVKATGPLTRLGENTVMWHKLKSGAVAPETLPSLPTKAAPFPGPAPADSVDLSVVLVTYNMRREAERTLEALSARYQQDIDDITYEVIVVDNGSTGDGALDAEFVTSFGPQFRFIEMGAEAKPSPIPAINRGILAGKGENFALMIDGAHVVTPKVIHYGLAGLAQHSPAVVAIQQFYTGPGQQGDAMQNGFDRAGEDALFDEIAWPEDGYRLFDIGHFIGTRDWFDGMWESNCLFASRDLLNQCGAFDENFEIAGGGYANLDLYERLGTTAGVNMVTVLGEGSFHQMHGGTTTNQNDEEERRRRVFGYGQEYAELRGRNFSGPQKPFHYLGSITSNTRRTKSRTMSGDYFRKAARKEGIDSAPTEPTPIPEEVGRAAIESYWTSLAWQDTTWLGQRIKRSPTDLVAYQELIAKIRPEWIIETGTTNGARAMFLASICELLGHGQVISISSRQADKLPEHDRLRYVESITHEPQTAELVAESVPDGSALVILGTAGTRIRMQLEMENYERFVGVDSYLVVENTIVNGNPVWPGFGPGPCEATRSFLGTRGNFVPDPKPERHMLSFNRGGFLRRTK